MRILYCFAIFCIIQSCTRGTGVHDRTNGNSTALTLPEGFTYQGRNPVMGDPDNILLIVEWNKRRSSLQFEVGDIIADTLTLRNTDGTELIMSRESAVSYYEKNYAGYSNQEITINAAIPIYYTDLDHEWVYSWIFREITSIDGDMESSYLHEDYRIIDGRIRIVYEFERDMPNQPVQQAPR